MTAQEIADSIYEHIKHGDEDHRRWLKEETLKWAIKFAGGKMAKIKAIGLSGQNKIYLIYCPGCKHDHPFEEPRWTFNGDFNKPTFTPSLLVNKGHSTQCHLQVTDGKIHFYDDCHHELKGQTLEMEEYES